MLHGRTTITRIPSSTKKATYPCRLNSNVTTQARQLVVFRACPTKMPNKTHELPKDPAQSVSHNIKPVRYIIPLSVPILRPCGVCIPCSALNTAAAFKPASGVHTSPLRLCTHVGHVRCCAHAVHNSDTNAKAHSTNQSAHAVLTSLSHRCVPACTAAMKDSSS